MGMAQAWIDSSFYDGESLLVGIVMRNSSRMTTYIPTETERLSMNEMDGVVFTEPAGAEEEAITEAYRLAVENGTPYGYIHYSLYTSDHIMTDDGIDIPTSSTMTDHTSEGDWYEMRECEVPLPAEVQNLPELTVNIRLYTVVTKVYFDGKACYSAVSARQEAGSITATIPKTARQEAHMSGTGSFIDIVYTVSADVSMRQFILQLTSRRR